MIANSTSLEGQFLVAMPRMGDSRFEETVIFICAHSEEGAMGFIVNRTMSEPGTVDFLQKLGNCYPEGRDCPSRRNWQRLLCNWGDRLSRGADLSCIHPTIRPKQP